MHVTDPEITPDGLEQEFSLATAATRLDFLSRRDNADAAPNIVAEPDAVPADNWLGFGPSVTSLDVEEALELLALGEVIARKAHGARLIGVRAALRGGADWSQIAAALGTTPRSAWDDYIVAVVTELDADDAAAARALAGDRPAP